MQQSKKLFQKAKQNRHTDRQSAKSNYQKCIQLNPKDEKAYFNLGNIFRQKGQLQFAVEKYKNVIKLNPNHYKAYLNLGQIYDDLNKQEDALICYNKVIQIFPTYQKAYYNLGNLYYELGRYQLAIKNLQKVIQINPNDQEALYTLGLSYQQLQQYQNSIILYKKAIQVNVMKKRPSKKPYQKLGMIYQKLQNYEQSLNYFTQCFSIFQSNDIQNKIIQLRTKLKLNVKEKKDEKIKQLNEEYSRYCLICQVKQKNCACIPCGHLIMCFQCGVLFKECPLCRQLMIPQRIYS